MKKIKIITDSTCDLNQQIIDKYDIEVIPLVVNFGDESYFDGVDIKLEEFLAKMNNSDIMPTTSQITPQRFLECYKKYIEDGYEIISLHLSSKMSGTYQSACIAKDMINSDKIYVIDSKNVTSGLGILVIKAAKLKEEGYSSKEIYNKIIETIPHVKSALIFASLDNLVKGGRLSKTVGAVGSLLNIKLILAVENGEMVVKEKVRGTKKAIKSIVDFIDKKGIKNVETSILLNVDTKDIRDNVKNKLDEKDVNYIECKVGCVVGTHSGADACGVFFIEDY